MEAFFLRRSPVPVSTRDFGWAQPHGAAVETFQNEDQGNSDFAALVSNENLALAPTTAPPRVLLAPDRDHASDAHAPQILESGAMTLGKASDNSDLHDALQDDCGSIDSAAASPNRNTEAEEPTAIGPDGTPQATSSAGPVDALEISSRDAEPAPVPTAAETAPFFEPDEVLPIDGPADAIPVIQDGPDQSEGVPPQNEPESLGSAGADSSDIDRTPEFVPAPAPRPPPKYRARLGQRPAKETLASTVPRGETPDAEPSEGTLDAELTLAFQPGGWGITLALLLRRKPGMAEEMRVQLGSDQHDICAIADDLFEPVFISDAASALLNGVAAETEAEPPTRWVRGGRNLHIFTERAGIAGFVSASRIVIGQENAILCCDEVAADALRVCSAVGSPGPEEISGPGLPAGWRCYRGIRPRAAVTPEHCDGALLALVPLPDAAIEFSGGISVGRALWLSGYAPSVRILGAVPNAGDVLIDDRPASCNDGGDWTAEGWDGNGSHTVRYAGLSRTYQIAPAPETWEAWEAHTFNSLSLCGGRVTSRTGSPIFASSAAPVWLVGRAPGEIAEMSARAPGSTPMAAPPFEPVWAVPVAPGRKRGRPFPCLIGAASVPLSHAAGHRRSSVRLWCGTIRSAGRDQKQWQRINPDEASLWALYRRTARALWRGSK